MHFISNVLVSTIALLAMVQYCPAPFIPAIAAMTAAEVIGTVSGVVGAAGGVAGAVEGGISAAHSKRDNDFNTRRFGSRIMQREDVSNLGLGTAWPDCKSELKESTLTFSNPSANALLVEGMPPACMTLSGVLTGKYNEGNPVPMSSSSIEFTNLSSADLKEIQDALDAHPNYKKN